MVLYTVREGGREAMKWEVQNSGYHVKAQLKRSRLAYVSSNFIETFSEELRMNKLHCYSIKRARHHQNFTTVH